MSTIKASGLGPLTASNTATIVDPATPVNGSATLGPLVSFASQNTTSGTSIDFIGIPSWAKRVTVNFSGVSLSGSAWVIVQIGGGSVETTGYTSAGYYLQTPSGNGLQTSTTGFLLYWSGSSATRHGSMKIHSMGSNLWVSDHSMYVTDPSTPGCILGGGSKTLSGTLDRVRITSSNGTDTFDAGSVNVMYE